METWPDVRLDLNQIQSARTAETEAGSAARSRNERTSPCQPTRPQRFLQGLPRDLAILIAGATHGKLIKDSPFRIESVGSTQASHYVGCFGEINSFPRSVPDQASAVLLRSKSS
jgi:hypothetical protein